jgi:hypothetical protein
MPDENFIVDLFCPDCGVRFPISVSEREIRSKRPIAICTCGSKMKVEEAKFGFFGIKPWRKGNDNAK